MQFSSLTHTGLVGVQGKTVGVTVSEMPGWVEMEEFPPVLRDFFEQNLCLTFVYGVTFLLLCILCKTSESESEVRVFM